MRLISLASGSSGNALLVQIGNVAGLIDCGVGPNRLRTQLLEFGLRLSDLSFVYVTHEHIDHIRAIPALTRSGVPIVTGAGTAAAMGLDSRSHVPIRAGGRFACGDLEVQAIPTSHDAAEPLAALVKLGRHTAAIFTDLGEWDERTVDAMAGADLIVVEANHNVEMLKKGPYPAHLKRRVLSPVGHLSNEACGRLTDAVYARAKSAPRIYLAHLSETNNTPAQAVDDVSRWGGWTHGDLTALPRSASFDLLSGVPASRRPPVETQQALFTLDQLF